MQMFQNLRIHNIHSLRFANEPLPPTDSKLIAPPDDDDDDDDDEEEDDKGSALSATDSK